LITPRTFVAIMSPARAPKSAVTPRKKASSPSEISPGVFVGGWKDALAFEGARFCVLDEAPSDMPAATHVTIYDDAADRPIVKNLDRVTEAMHVARAKNEPVLVFCGHGIRRSPMAGAWYLHRFEGLSLDGAYARIREIRPKVEHARDWVGDPAPLSDNA
jgi:hypothetical protein